MSVLTSLLLVIVTARLIGRLFLRFGQPALVGEVLGGIIIGPSLLGVVSPNAALSGISELAQFLVVLSAGLEMEFRDVVSVLRRGKGLLVAVIGFLLPLAAGMLVGVAFGFDAIRTVFLGLCISITALPVAVRILESFRLLETDIARYAVGTAVFNDVAALLALGVILDLPATRTFTDVSLSIAVTGGKLILLAVLILGLNRLLEELATRGVRLQLVPERVIDLFGNEALFGFLIVFVLVFGSISEALGFHFVIGAFFGALLIDRQFFLVSRYRELQRTLSSITGGFLAPVFFAYIGLQFTLVGTQSPWFVAAVLLVSIGSKMLAGWVGGRMVGLPKPEALGLGIIFNGRGIMELVVASIAFDRGFIGQGLFSTLVLMGVVTTLLTPLLFRRYTLPHLAVPAPAPAVLPEPEPSATSVG